MSNIIKFNHIIKITLILSSIAEFVFFPSAVHVCICVVNYLMWLIFSSVISKGSNYLYYPLSTFMVTGFTLCFIVLPIPATLLEFKPVSYNLHNPLVCFLNIYLCLVALMVAHCIYKNISKKNIISLCLRKTSFFSPLSKKEFLIFTIGAISYTAISILVYGRWEDDNNLESKPLILSILSLMGMFVNLPVLLLFPTFHLVNWKSEAKSKYLFCILYGLILFVIGVASNVRTMSINYICLIGALFFFGFLTNSIKVTLKKQYVVSFLVLLWFFTGPFMDISMAMVAVRGQKMNLSGIELLENTFAVYSNGKEMESLRKAKTMLVVGGNDWDENYLNNDMLARFCSVKIFDESIFYAEKLGYNNTQMKDDYLHQLMSIWPTNISGLSKKERDIYRSYSETDYMYALATKSGLGLGSFKIGSLPGLGLAIFGYWYLLIIILMFIPIFYYFDSTIYRKNNKLVISPWAALNLFMVFYYISSGHNYVTETRFLFREFFESVMTYLLLRIFIRKLCN